MNNLNPLKQLAGQTAVYGLSSVFARLLNFLLVPFYTRILTDTAEYGIVNELYAYVAFIIVILTYGMETAFFRFSSKTDNPKIVYSTALTSVTATSFIFLAVIILFYNDIASIMGYGNNSSFVLLLGLVLGADALSSIPFARLRHQGRAVRFALIKLFNVCVNVFFNIFFLAFLPWICSLGYSGWFIDLVYDPSFSVGYVFVSNLIASSLTLCLFIKEILKIRFGFSAAILRSMLVYAFPLLISGLAGTVNEFFDRILLRYRLPENVNVLEQIGIYGANVKIAVLMILFIQMFRYAFEPFIFSQEKNKSGKRLYADVLYYFTIAGVFVFLVITLYIDIFKQIIDTRYHEGVAVVPIILYGNLLLGIYFNLSVWYKLKDKTVYGAIFALCGALVTITINWVFIPFYGYMASAWGHLFAYLVMVLVSYFIGRRYYPVPYKVSAILGYLGAGAVLFIISQVVKFEGVFVQYAVNTVILAIFTAFVAYREHQFLRNLFKSDQ